MAIKEATWSVPGRNLHRVVLYQGRGGNQWCKEAVSGAKSVAIRVASRKAVTCPGSDEGGNQWGKSRGNHLSG